MIIANININKKFKNTIKQIQIPLLLLMFQVQPGFIVSSLVTIVTSTIFIFITKNLSIETENYDNFNNENEKLTINADKISFSELVEGNENSNEIDFELLEEKFKLLEESEIIVDSNDEKESEIVDSNEDEIICEDENSKSTTNLKDSSLQDSSGLSIKATHKLLNSGQHRSYILSLNFNPRSSSSIPWSNCKLKLQWPLPRNVLVDVWALRRLGPFTIKQFPGGALNPGGVKVNFPVWSVKPRHPDLEIGAYDPKARPFILTAEISFTKNSYGGQIEINDGKLVNSNAPWNMNLHVPDVFIRYQTPVPGSLFQKHPNKISYLPTPQLQFICDDDVETLHVDWQLNQLRPLQISLPIGSANPLVAHVTSASVVLCSLLLLFTFLKI